MNRAEGASFRLEWARPTAQEWARLASAFAGSNLMQCWEYGETKAETGPWRVERGVFFAPDGGVVGVVQALVRRLPFVGAGLAWINRGPLWRTPRDLAPGVEPLLAMLEQLGRHYVERAGLYLRIAPNVAAGELAGDGLARAGLRTTATLGWASAVVDLKPEPDEIRKRLDQKWRNALNKAERSAIEIAAGTDGPAFAEFLDAHARQAGVRAFAGAPSAAFLRRLQEKLPDDRKMEAIVARQGGTTVASVLIVRYGGTAEYLAGNVSEQGRSLNAGQLLLWRALAGARERGADAFDVGGMDAALTRAGIYRFKQGLGGAPYRLADEAEAWRGAVNRLVRWRVSRARR